MHYMLMFYETPTDFAARDTGGMAAWMAYVQALAQSGVTRSGNGLQPPMLATSVRVRGGQRAVQDGPFADTKEQLGGYFIIEVPDLDSALSWAERAPCAATGGVEVRPVLPVPAA